MNELIERLEKATGPDRELDADIYQYVHGVTGRCVAATDYFYNKPPVHHITVSSITPAYTASFDAAKALVPTGGAWVAHGPWKDGTYCAGVSLTPEGAWDDDNVGSNEAIALCIAALKVRG